MRIAILGGTGFLGKHVGRLAREAGHDVVSISRHEGCDATDLTAICRCLANSNPCAVINCAAHVGSVHYVARRAADVVDDNTRILLNVYRAVHQACPQAIVVNPLSNCSYPGDTGVQREAEWFSGPVHESVVAYGTTRRMLYNVAACYRAQHAIRSVNWLVANAYGPGDYTDPERVHALNGIVIRLIEARRARQRAFEIWGSGRPVREWCYIEDVARMLVMSVDLEEQLYPLNLAQNRGYSIADIARLAAQTMNYEVEFVFNADYSDGAPEKILDEKRFREQYPDFVFTPLEQGIENTIAYYEPLL